MNPLSIDEYAIKGRGILRERMLLFISQNQPIKFSIMGFPMKSTNTRDKVLGVLPDMAEQLTLENFADFNMHDEQFYKKADDMKNEKIKN
jgi:pyoverdine/dityrosine biosynthesis protein Dit1